MTNMNDTMHILLADDDIDDRNLFKEALNDINADVNFQSFTSGTDLMLYLHSEGYEAPHIIFLDLNMPGKSGHQCLQEIRDNPKYKDISIAIYSTSNAEEDIIATLSGGANVYIHKPDDFEKLRDIITHVLKINWQYHTSGLNKDTFFLSL